MRIILNRHEHLWHSGSGFPLGEKIDSEEWLAASAPRVGELITSHPNIEIGEDHGSWTGRGTSVQHVFHLGEPHVAICTVMDDRG